MLTYAQNFEDVMLARLFFGQQTGFYVDVGASHPTNLSVTKHFYELGWRGINIEPIEENWSVFKHERPRDINLNVAVGSVPGEQRFYLVLENNALSTCNPARAAELARSGMTVVERVVQVATLNSVLDRFGQDEIDFLKVDIEGGEKDVVTSIDLGRHRPKVLLIEATKQLQQFPGWDRFNLAETTNYRDWEQHLFDHDYVFAHFDGLNRFYLRKDCSGLVGRLALPPGVFDFILPDLLAATSIELQQKEAVIQDQSRQLKEKKAVIQSRIRRLWKWRL